VGVRVSVDELRPDVAAWLGRFETTVTEVEAEQLTAAFDRVLARYPSVDQAEERELALLGVKGVVLREQSLEQVGTAWQQARDAERAAMYRLTGAMLATTEGSEYRLATRAGVHRSTVRKALGK